MRSPATNVGQMTVKVEVAYPRPRVLSSYRHSLSRGRFPDPAHIGSRHPDGCALRIQAVDFHRSAGKAGRAQVRAYEQRRRQLSAQVHFLDCWSGRCAKLAGPAQRGWRLHTFRYPRRRANARRRWPEPSARLPWCGAFTNLVLAETRKAVQAIFEGRATLRSGTG
jgi:hypothetical protein